MRYLVPNVVTGLEEPLEKVALRLARRLGFDIHALRAIQCVRRAIDARRKHDVHFVCHYEIELKHPLKHLPRGVRRLEHSQLEPVAPDIFTRRPEKTGSVIVVGAGPAGLFAALALAEAGFRVTLLERGKPVEHRMRDIGRLRSRGELNPESNICFGEGGAGTYTDGKLYTRIKHPFVRWVLQTFVRFGANKDILVDAHPHLGTDKLVRIVRRMREHLIGLGVDYRFECRVDDLLVRENRIHGVRTASGESMHAEFVILATGHSARDTFERLYRMGLPMEAKPFAIGLRAEHPQSIINACQYGQFAGHQRLGAAEYRLSYQVEDEHLGRRGIYTFCMCPGGLIVPSPTEPGHMAINGMSNAKRAGRWANAGVVAQVSPDDLVRHGLHAHSLVGMTFQREVERACHQAVGNRYAAPAMRLVDFLSRATSSTPVASSFKPEIVPADLSELLPTWLADPLRKGLQAFGRKMPGFITEEANLLAIESRTSSPIRMLRNKRMECVTVAGLMPVGEGAGYAGGIVSAAVDGLRAAQSIIERY
ncbi:MAG: FAD-dependent oxidoreductase [Zetaproteobacteria bacterium]|nr:MAG: FAD-dependent oxidoreductase [Zetaproteobacteria bacterium]